MTYVVLAGSALTSLAFKVTFPLLLLTDVTTSKLTFPLLLLIDVTTSKLTDLSVIVWGTPLTLIVSMLPPYAETYVASTAPIFSRACFFYASVTVYAS